MPCLRVWVRRLLPGTTAHPPVPGPNGSESAALFAWGVSMPVPALPISRCIPQHKGAGFHSILNRWELGAASLYEKSSCIVSGLWSTQLVHRNNQVSARVLGAPRECHVRCTSYEARAGFILWQCIAVQMKEATHRRTEAALPRGPLSLISEADVTPHGHYFNGRAGNDHRGARISSNSVAPIVLHPDPPATLDAESDSVAEEPTCPSGRSFVHKNSATRGDRHPYFCGENEYSRDAHNVASAGATPAAATKSPKPSRGWQQRLEGTETRRVKPSRKEPALCGWSGRLAVSRMQSAYVGAVAPNRLQSERQLSAKTAYESVLECRRVPAPQSFTHSYAGWIRLLVIHARQALRSRICAGQSL